LPIPISFCARLFFAVVVTDKDKDDGRRGGAVDRGDKVKLDRVLCFANLPAQVRCASSSA